MNRYFLVENGEIKIGPRSLPKCWKHVSGLHLATEKELTEYGWLKEEIQENESFDSVTQNRAGPFYEIQGSKVIVKYEITDKTKSELKEFRLNDAQREFDRRMGEHIISFGQTEHIASAIIAVNAGQEIPEKIISDFQKIETLKEKFETLKNSIEKMTITDLKALDVTTNNRW